MDEALPTAGMGKEGGAGPPPAAPGEPSGEACPSPCASDVLRWCRLLPLGLRSPMGGLSSTVIVGAGACWLTLCSEGRRLPPRLPSRERFSICLIGAAQTPYTWRSLVSSCLRRGLRGMVVRSPSSPPLALPASGSSSSPGRAPGSSISSGPSDWSSCLRQWSTALCTRGWNHSAPMSSYSWARRMVFSTRLPRVANARVMFF
mmetsp:Transcript_4678/g.12991  ORF Transcript_4678/g.12991 Transcript_4678/m.12991 type:complete len:203 (+) Transcript_4678:2028-2636(+)